jgi:hypothetical protein
MAIPQPVMMFGILVFIGGLIWTFVLLGQNSGSKDNSDEVKNALGQVALINGFLIAVLAGISFLYIGANPTFERPYILVMLHATLFLSLLAASTAVIQQLNMTPNSSQNAQPSNCKA